MTWDEWDRRALLAHMVGLAHWGADAEQVARHPQLAVDLAGAAAAVQAYYDGDPHPRSASTAAADDDDDPAVALRARADEAGGFLAVPAGEVRAAVALKELTLGQSLGVYSLGVLPAPDRLPAADAALVVLYPELSAVGDILRTAAAVAAGEARGRTWPVTVEARITGDRQAGAPHLMDRMP